jgi:hypothetical protein
MNTRFRAVRACLLGASVFAAGCESPVGGGASTETGTSSETSSICSCLTASVASVCIGTGTDTVTFGQSRSGIGTVDDAGTSYVCWSQCTGGCGEGYCSFLIKCSLDTATGTSTGTATMTQTATGTSTETATTTQPVTGTSTETATTTQPAAGAGIGSGTFTATGTRTQ